MSEPGPCRLRFARYGSQRRSCGGAVAIEFTLVFMIFFLLFYGIVAYGIAFTIKQSVTMAAEEGARAALKDAPDVPARLVNADSMATGFLSFLPVGSFDVIAELALDPVPPGCAPPIQCVRVVVTYDYAGYPIVPSLPTLGISIPDSLGATAIVKL